MSKRRGADSAWLFSLAFVVGAALTAGAQMPNSFAPSGRATPIRPASYSSSRSAAMAQRNHSLREDEPSDPLAKRQVMIRQIGFEAQQQGYAAKVQGAVSQNVLWITPREHTYEPSRRSWLTSWREFFDLSD